MNVVQANKFYFRKGGAETYLFDVSTWLAGQGHKVIPFAMRHPDNLETPFSTYFPSFVPTERVRFDLQGLRTFGRMFYSFEARRKMARLLDDERPDVAHVHNIYTQLSPSILDAMAARGVPIVMTVHDHHLVSPQYNLWAPGCGPDYSNVGLLSGTRSAFHKGSRVASFAQVTSFAFHYNRGSYRNRVDLFLTPSDYMRRKLVAAGFPEEKIRVNQYGADPGSVVPTYDHEGYLLYVGRLSEEKGVETVIDVARQLPDLSFKIVGTGPWEDLLHSRAHGADNVEFMGYRSGDDLRALYRGAMAVLIPSRVHEVFPLVTLEAMLHGKPVIGSNVGGMPEVVEDRVTGLLAPPNDLRAWVEAVMRLAYDEEARVRLARASRLAVETTFHLSGHWKRVMDAYEFALARHGKTA